MKMSDFGDLVFSDDAAITRVLFFQGKNDINFFFEDTNKEWMYETILKRLFGESIKFETVFCVGGKSKVEEAYHLYGEEVERTKNYYIVDGDFDRYIYSDQMIENSCFIYLKTYNIESYFVDKHACSIFAKGRLKCKDSIVEEKIQFDDWKEKIIEQAQKLFFVYCYIKKHQPTIKNVDRGAYYFIDNKTGFERTGVYESLIDEIKVNDEDIYTKLSAIKEKYEEINGENYFNLICGKFLLASLNSYLYNIIPGNINKNDFEWILINNFDISKLNYIKEAIIKS